MNDLERFVARLVAILEQRDVAALHRPVRIKDLRDSVIPYRFNRSVLGLSSSEEYELLLLRLIAEEGGLVRVAPADTADRLREELAGPNPDLELIEVLGDTTVQLTDAGIAAAREFRAAQTQPRPEETRTIHDAPEETAAAAAAGTDTGDSAWAPRPADSPSDPAAGGPPPEPLAPPAEEEPEPEFEPLADSISVEEEPAPPVTTDGGADQSPEPEREAAVQCASCEAALPTHRTVAFCPFCGAPAGVRRCVRCGSEIEPGWKHCVACGHLAGANSFA